MFLDLDPVLHSRTSSLVLSSMGFLALPSGCPPFPSALDSSEASTGDHVLLSREQHCQSASRLNKGGDPEACLHLQQSHFLLGQSDGSFGNKLSWNLCKFSVNYILFNFCTKSHIPNSFGDLSLSLFLSFSLSSHLQFF